MGDSLPQVLQRGSEKAVAPTQSARNPSEANQYPSLHVPVILERSEESHTLDLSEPPKLFGLRTVPAKEVTSWRAGLYTVLTFPFRKRNLTRPIPPAPLKAGRCILLQEWDARWRGSPKRWPCIATRQPLRGQLRRQPFSSVRWVAYSEVLRSVMENPSARRSRPSSSGSP